MGSKMPTWYNLKRWLFKMIWDVFSVVRNLELGHPKRWVKKQTNSPRRQWTTSNCNLKCKFPIIFTSAAVLLFGSTLCNPHSKDRIYFLRVLPRNSFPYWMISWEIDFPVWCLGKKQLFLSYIWLEKQLFLMDIRTRNSFCNTTNFPVKCSSEK